MIAGLSPSSCCELTPFKVSTPSSNPLLANARKKNTAAYTRNIRAPNTIRPAPLRKDCSLDIVSSLLSTTFELEPSIISEQRLECLHVAQSGHPDHSQQCPLLGVKRTLGGLVAMSVPDPKR